MILCIDTRPDDTWQKRWEQLDVSVTRWSPSQLRKALVSSTALSGYVIVLLHDSVFAAWADGEPHVHILKGVEPPFVMYVSSAPTSQEIDPQHLTHRTMVPFPNNADLNHLRRPFHKLVKSLRIIRENADSDTSLLVKQRQAAWASWEREARPGQSKEVLPALAILCQGYLAVHAPRSGTKATGELAAALQHIGWDSIAPDAKLPDLSGRNATVEALSWWTAPFTEYPDLCAAASAELGDTQMKPGLEELLSGLTANSGSVAVETVVAAYKDLAEVLGGAPWPNS